MTLQAIMPETSKFTKKTQIEGCGWPKKPPNNPACADLPRVGYPTAAIPHGVHMVANLMTSETVVYPAMRDQLLKMSSIVAGIYYLDEAVRASRCGGLPGLASPAARKPRKSRLLHSMEHLSSTGSDAQQEFAPK